MKKIYLILFCSLLFAPESTERINLSELLSEKTFCLMQGSLQEGLALHDSCLNKVLLTQLGVAETGPNGAALVFGDPLNSEVYFLPIAVNRTVYNTGSILRMRLTSEEYNAWTCQAEAEGYRLATTDLKPILIKFFCGSTLSITVPEEMRIDFLHSIILFFFLARDKQVKDDANANYSMCLLQSVPDEVLYIRDVNKTGVQNWTHVPNMLTLKEFSSEPRMRCFVDEDGEVVISPKLPDLVNLTQLFSLLDGSEYTKTGRSGAKKLFESSYRYQIIIGGKEVRPHCGYERQEETIVITPPYRIIDLWETKNVVLVDDMGTEEHFVCKLPPVANYDTLFCALQEAIGFPKTRSRYQICIGDGYPSDHQYMGMQMMCIEDTVRIKDLWHSVALFIEGVTGKLYVKIPQNPRLLDIIEELSNKGYTCSTILDLYYFKFNGEMIAQPNNGDPCYIPNKSVDINPKTTIEVLKKIEVPIRLISGSVVGSVSVTEKMLLGDFIYLLRRAVDNDRFQKNKFVFGATHLNIMPPNVPKVHSSMVRPLRECHAKWFEAWEKYEENLRKPLYFNRRSTINEILLMQD